MINYLRLSVLAYLLFTLLLAGCSSNGNPVEMQDSEISSLSYSVFPAGVSDFDSNGNPSEGYGALGIFNVHINSENLSGEITSLRKSSLEDVLEVVDITNFLKVSPCKDCVRINGVEYNADGNVVVYIGIKHPFPAGNVMQPPSGRNRADLHVFNVEGLVVAETGYTTNFAGIGEQVSDFQLLNADGYSAYLDGACDKIFDTTATLHPYILHFDDYTSGNYDPVYPTGFQSVTTPPPSGYLVMPMGSDYDYQPYEFGLIPGESLDFIFAVGCTYAVSAASKIERFTPEYRVPQHLKKAASEVKVRIVDNQLYSGNTLSFATIAIDVVDISQDIEVGTGLGQMKADSSVGKISLDVPGVMSSVMNVPLTNTGGSGHDPSDPLTYAATVTNQLGATEGMYHGLVKVTDTYPPGSNTSPLLLGNDGIERVDPTQNPLEGLFAIAEFATYQYFEIEIQNIPNDHPVAILEPDDPTIYEGNVVNFDATSSYDTDGTIELYEFDFDWDGINGHFSSDESNTTGLAQSDPYDVAGSYTAGLRVTDDLNGKSYDSVTVTVNEWTSQCPDAPFAGDTFTQGMSYSDYNRLGSTGWAVWADQIIDMDILSNGNMILIYADGYSESASYPQLEGDLWMVNPLGGTLHTDVVPGQDYPGHIGISMDVDLDDIAIFVTSDLPHTDFVNNNARDYTLTERINAAHDFFYVIDPLVGISTSQTVNVGTPVMAVETDASDDVWVLDANRVMHKYEKSNGYTENVAASFDLDVTTGGAFTGQVYDMVIDFYNEAFFILTDGSTWTSVWRIECNGQYNSQINGHPNPINNVLPVSTTGAPLNGLADIAIDNLNASGVALTGKQDSQIVVVGGDDDSPVTDPYWDYYALVARIDSELNQRVTSTYRSFIEAFTCGSFNQRTNQLWGIAPGVWSDGYSVLWLPPSGWY
jgi:hypothetical protein